MVILLQWKTIKVLFLSSACFKNHLVFHLGANGVTCAWMCRPQLHLLMTILTCTHCAYRTNQQKHPFESFIFALTFTLNCHVNWYLWLIYGQKLLKFSTTMMLNANRKMCVCRHKHHIQTASQWLSTNRKLQCLLKMHSHSFTEVHSNLFEWKCLVWEIQLKCNERINSIRMSFDKSNQLNEDKVWLVCMIFGRMLAML